MIEIAAMGSAKCLPCFVRRKHGAALWALAFVGHGIIVAGGWTYIHAAILPVHAMHGNHETFVRPLLLAMHGYGCTYNVGQTLQVPK